MHPHVATPLREASSTASLHLKIRKMFPNVNFNKCPWTNSMQLIIKGREVAQEAGTRGGLTH